MHVVLNKTSRANRIRVCLWKIQRSLIRHDKHAWNVGLCLFWLTPVCVCRPGQRTGDDLEIIYDELLHIKALAHLSNTVSQLVSFCF